MKKKKVLSLLMTAILTMSLAACGGTDPDSGSSGNSGSGSQTEQSGADDAGSSGQSDADSSQGGQSDTDDAGSSGQSDAGSSQTAEGPLAPYNETVTLEVALMINADLNYQEGDDITNKPWIRGYKEKLNIEVVPAFTAEWDDYFTNINLAIADKTLPDVCMVQTTQLQQLIEADMLNDL